MGDIKVGDLVARKSYGGDVYFTVIDIKNGSDGKRVYRLRGQTYRIEADSHGEDLVLLTQRHAQMNRDKFRYITDRHISRLIMPRNIFSMDRSRIKTGRILHIDSSEEFLNICIKHYKQLNLSPVGYRVDEEEQPGMIRGLLEREQPDILVVTGHDGLKKNYSTLNSVDSYRNSRYYIQSVVEARKYEADSTRLCVFAGACQSYFEGIMSAGANFASSPGRVLINALDPAFVAQKVALTESTRFVTAQEVGQMAISGSKGIGGINTRGHLVRE